MPGICLAYDWHTVEAGRSVALAARAWQDSLAYAWHMPDSVVPVFLRLFTLVAYAWHMPDSVVPVFLRLFTLEVAYAWHMPGICHLCAGETWQKIEVRPHANPGICLAYAWHIVTYCNP